jgi:OOP family OmpA-OmpF porin
MAFRALALSLLPAVVALPTALTAQNAPAVAFDARPEMDFPYVHWPREFLPQNTPVNQGFGHFLFWDGKALQNVEGQTFLVTLVAAEGQSTFNEYLIRKTIEEEVGKMGGFKVAVGRIPLSVISEMTDVDKQSLSAGLGDIYNDPVQVWRIPLPKRDIWVQYTDNSAQASIAIVESNKGGQ